MMRNGVTLAMALCLAACVSQGRPIAVTTVSDASQFADAQTLTVNLSDYAFTPETLRMNGREPYTLRLVNTGTDGHDFTAPDFFQAAQIYAADADKVVDGRVNLREGSETTIRLIPARGTYELVCSHFGHAALGMTGYIQVR